MLSCGILHGERFIMNADLALQANLPAYVHFSRLDMLTPSTALACTSLYRCISVHQGMVGDSLNKAQVAEVV